MTPLNTVPTSRRADKLLEFGNLAIQVLRDPAAREPMLVAVRDCATAADSIAIAGRAVLGAWRRLSGAAGSALLP